VPGSPSASVLPFDLAHPEDLVGRVEHVECVVFCAAITSMRACEHDPVGTSLINVRHTVATIKPFLDNGSFVIFLSSSAVFDGETPYPDERSPVTPVTEYGRQKAEVERQLLALDAGRCRVCIVRPTKVLATKLPLIQRFLHALHAGHPAEAFTDLVLSPISIDYVVNALLRMARAQIGGIYHLSGDQELSYARLLVELAQACQVNPASVRGTPSNDGRSPIPLFLPRHPALGMRITEETYRIRPQPLQDVLNAIAH
jgi:dTDP-4-dehydrorhamnose reductase